MQQHPMPWSFKAALVAFGIFAIGAGLIVFAHFQGRWESIVSLAYGLLISAAGLAGILLFSLICAVTHLEWRRRSLIAVAIAVLLSVALFLVARAA